MKKIGVITADIVGSTKIPPDKRGLLPLILKELVSQFQILGTPVHLEIYRGDSFQLVIDECEKSLFIAVLLRVGLMRNRLAPSEILDARMSLGMGRVSFESDSVGQSDGEAFVLSGRSFDEIGKRKLLINTSELSINSELAVYAAILDDLLSDLSQAQSKVVFEHLCHPNLTMEKIGKELHITKQAVSQSFKAAGGKIIDLILKRAEEILIDYAKR